MTTAPAVGLIWAQTPAGVVGADNTIPWHVPEDTAHFKELTWGHPVVMGRRTWDSLPPRYRPLPGRRNIVVTGQPAWAAVGAERAESLDQALHTAGTGPIWVIGGADIYRQALPHATVLAVTEVDVSVPGDAHAPTIGPDWRLHSDSGWQVSQRGPRYRWRRYVRR